MRRSSSFHLAALFVIGSAGCVGGGSGGTGGTGSGTGATGDGSGTGTGTGTGTDTTSGPSTASVAYNGAAVPVEKFEETLADLYCKLAVLCGSGGNGGKFEFATVEGCKAFSAGELGSDKLSALVKAGKVKYDAAAVGKCLQFITSSCGNMGSGATDSNPSCAAAFTGVGKEGTACTGGQECESGDCAGMMGENCPGKCGKHRGSVGEVCAADPDCKDSLKCTDKKCAVRPAAKAGESCMDTSCEKGLTCSSSGDKATCNAPGGADATCDSSESCAAEFYCKQGMDSPNGKCTARAKLGDACTPEGGPAAVPCVSSSKCIKAGDKATCTAAVKMGGACTASAQCAGIDLACTGGTCKLVPKKGEACTMADPMSGVYITCLPPSVCVSNKCDDPPGDGKPCPDGQCAKGLSCDFKAKVCKAPPGDGQPCSGQCKSGFTCSFDAGKSMGTCKAQSCGGP